MALRRISAAGAKTGAELKTTLPLIASLAFLAACQLTGGASTLAAHENRAPPANARAQGVDGLLVGHRLMAAGEPELALKAYYRAAAEQGIDADVLSAVGSANLALGRLGQAEQMLRRSLEMDPAFVPALNNLGVVLMERGNVSEARVIFQQAYALDSGNTDSIRENLKRAIAMIENSGYSAPPEDVQSFELVRRGQEDDFVVLSAL